jgi:RNA polymerase sigma-70 factor (ECF subfamily)
LADLDEMQPVLFRFALRAVGDTELANDLTQDALVAALAQRGAFEGRSQLRTWVIGILSHKIADYFRKRAVRGDEGDGDLLSAPSDEDVERVVGARRELAQVEKALARLPERERLALLLIDVEGVTREESCRVLEVTATHLRVLLHRARNRLRRILEGGRP